ncbi:MAG: FAD-dependent protein [Ruminococcus sp.]
MIRISGIYLPPNYTDEKLRTKVQKELKCKGEEIKSIKLFKLSIDARKKNDVHFLATVDVELKNENRVLKHIKSKKVTVPKEYKYVQPICKNNSHTVVVGAGPAGLFASLILARSGMEVTLVERGKSVEERTKDVENFWNNRELNTNSNVQFGEGGAGAFSDGKLTTGTKDVRIRKVFEEFVSHGAPKEILYDSKPHIGTDRLKPTIKNIREEIISLGGKVLFSTRLTDIKIKDNKVYSAVVESDEQEKEIFCDNVIVAIGHSSRDTFRMFKNKGLMIEPKPFAVGARIEHLREKIDISQYGDFYKEKKLGAAPYKLSTHLENGRGVYTFCMCPGGVVVGAQSEENTVVTNGMSYYARDEVNSNSALLVGVSPDDFWSDDVLAGMYFQEEIERKAFLVGGGNYNAPVQRVGDFLKKEKSNRFGEVLPSYKPGTSFAMLEDILPEFITNSMRQGIIEMDKRLNGFMDNDALLTGVESRSSSPIRILRNKDTMEALGIEGLYPCGEGAGYAGGIVSAGVDGIKCAEKIIEKVNG